MIDPFLRYPNLLKVVLDILRQGAVQRMASQNGCFGAMKLLGVVGALDPDHPDPKLRHDFVQRDVLQDE